MINKSYLVLLLILIESVAYAQEQLKINFKHISHKEGLVQSPISNFLQDDKGFIWFGNLKGLNRYDGYEFKTYVQDENNIKSLSNNKVKVVFQDLDKNVWIGTANGLNLYNRDLETFTRIDVLDIKGGRNYISSIGEDKQKNLWIGTFGGLKKLNRKTKQLEDTKSISGPEGLGSIAIFSLFIDNENNIWAGTKHGLQKFNPATGKVIPLPAAFRAVSDLKPKVLVTRQDKTGALWFGTEENGVFKYEKKGKVLRRYVSSETNARTNTLASNWVKDILIYDENTIWFATGNGISILNPHTEQFSTHRHNPLNPNSLNDNAIWSFMKDKATCVWVGTFAGGINFYYKGNSNFLNIGESVGSKVKLNHLLVNAISEDQDGSLWVGTYGGGLNHIDRDKNRSEYFSIKSDKEGSSVNGIKCLADDGRGNLWVGTLDGLNLFNKRSKAFKHFSFEVKDGKLSENLINVVLPDGEGAWVGTNGGGLRYLLPDGRTTIVLRKGAKESNPGGAAEGRNAGLSLSDNYVTALLKDNKGNLWVGTQSGLNYYDLNANKITSVFKKSRETKYHISNSGITALFMDSKYQLWIGTDGGGLNYFDEKTNRFYAINKSLGLGDEVIHAIVEDKDQNLWLSTDVGLFKLRIKTFFLPFNKQSIEITEYSANDGLVSNQFSKGAGAVLKSGELTFGGINGLSIFYPEKIIKNTLPPRVALTEILINSKEVYADTVGSPLAKAISETEEIVVDHDQGNLSIKYSALNFINPENNRYAYKLEGLANNEEWHDAGNQRIVNFANLPPGSYNFKVKAANNDGVWGPYVRTLKIVVLPPWWSTWWAYTIYTIIALTILIIVDKFLRNRERLKRDLYFEHLQNERQQELYQMKLNFFTNISHEIRTPLTLIIGPLEKLLASSEHAGLSKQLVNIKNNADRLLKLVTELLDFRKAEEGHMKIHCSYQDLIPFCRTVFQSFEGMAFEKNIDYKFISPKESVFLYFDTNQMEKVIFNLLSNATKFTNDEGRITLSIEVRGEDEKWVDIKITDNGKGIPKDYQDELFQSFFQVDDRGRQNIGSGIGLALSKSIVELHKGEIKVECHDIPQPLTIFTVSLRTGENHLSESQILVDTVISKDYPTQLVGRNVDFDEGSEQDVAASNKKYNVLIAEDNEEVRKLIADFLEEEYNIVEFANGKEALDYTRAQIPDLIVSDIMMPEMDGLELCRNVKTLECTSHIPFILLTARASVSNQIDGFSTGADAYISKPFSPQILELNIKNLLKAQEVMREKFSRQLILQPTNISITTPEEKFLHKLMEIIEDKMGNADFDVNELVNEIGMSRTVLYKKVHALTNHSVADLIKQMRLKKAGELFKVSKLPVAEVAYMVGFNDRKHFSKEFKKQYQVSPSEYLQALAEKV